MKAAQARLAGRSWAYFGLSFGATTVPTSGVIFSSGGALQLDSGSHLSGTISGFHLGEEIDLRGLAFSSSSSTLTWKQTTSGANASGTLTVKEGTSSTTLTMVGSYTVSNFSATSDGHGGTLIHPSRVALLSPIPGLVPAAKALPVRRAAAPPCIPAAMSSAAARGSSAAAA